MPWGCQRGSDPLKGFLLATDPILSLPHVPPFLDDLYNLHQNKEREFDEDPNKNTKRNLRQGEGRKLNRKGPGTKWERSRSR
jgi:hypothetical protein